MKIELNFCKICFFLHLVSYIYIYLEAMGDIITNIVNYPKPRIDIYELLKYRHLHMGLVCTEINSAIA